jgi:hypothetical protein
VVLGSSASNRNEYQEYFIGGECSQCIGVTNLLHSCADCLDIRQPQPRCILRACIGLLYLLCLPLLLMSSSWDSSVSIVISLWAGLLRLLFSDISREYSAFKTVRSTNPATQHHIPDTLNP